MVVPLGKFASTNQKHYPDLGSDVSSVWNFCARSFRGETSGGVTKCRLFLRLSQTPLIRTMRRPKKVDILMGCSCNERAFFSQGQSKLSVIMSFPYYAGLLKAGFDCNYIYHTRLLLMYCLTFSFRFLKLNQRNCA